MGIEGSKKFETKKDNSIAAEKINKHQTLKEEIRNLETWLLGDTFNKGNRRIEVSTIQDLDTKDPEIAFGLINEGDVVRMTYSMTGGEEFRGKSTTYFKKEGDKFVALKYDNQPYNPASIKKSADSIELMNYREYSKEETIKELEEKRMELNNL